MPALTAVVTHATGDVFPASDWNSYVRDDINYLITAGATLASAAAITVTNEFHTISGTTTIQTITATTPVAGQQLRLYFQSGLSVDGSVGNIRFTSGVGRKVRPNEILTLVYDGANWREQRPVPGALLSYVRGTAPSSSSATTFATGVTIIASNLAWTADGLSDYLMMLWGGELSNSSAAANSLISADLDNGTELGRIAFGTAPTAGGGSPVSGAIILAAPAAGAHTLNARLLVGGGTATYNVGAGGAGAFGPSVALLYQL